jgi:hypothetical protein
MQDAATQIAPPEALEALETWAPFTLHPMSLRTPIGWLPVIVDWTEQSARVRWESLTGTPLEINWVWLKAPTGSMTEREQKRVDEAWKREVAGAEKQAKTANVEFRWRGESRSPRSYCGLEAEGRIREYLWDGLPGALSTVSFSVPGRRVFLSAACCPSISCDDPAKTIQRVLRSLTLFGETDPLRICVPGASLEWPAAFHLTNVRGREGHFYLDVEAPGKRVGLARLGFADWHLSGQGRDKVWAALAKLLFDRCEPNDPVHTTISGGRPTTERTVLGRAPEKDPEAAEASVREHEGAVFLEKRGFHIRFGDWVLRHSARKFAGQAAVLAWHCPATHALWALSARCGAEDAEAFAREMLAKVTCHGEADFGRVDWSRYTKEETRPRPGTHPAPDPKAKGPPPNAGDHRRVQLGFRVRTLPEVRLEPSSKDGTGDLVYEATAQDSFLARVLRGGRAPEVGYRRLSLDAIGRRTWEELKDGRSVGEVLAVLSRELAVHPVEMFPKLLSFLKLLGERRLIEPTSREECEEKETAKA